MGNFQILSLDLKIVLWQDLPCLKTVEISQKTPLIIKVLDRANLVLPCSVNRAITFIRPKVSRPPSCLKTNNNQTLSSDLQSLNRNLNTELRTSLLNHPSQMHREMKTQQTMNILTLPVKRQPVSSMSAIKANPNTPMPIAMPYKLIKTLLNRFPFTTNQPLNHPPSL
jgi:hypothetical protein